MDKHVLVNYIMTTYIPKRKFNYKYIIGLLGLGLFGLFIYSYRYKILEIIEIYLNIQ